MGAWNSVIGACWSTVPIAHGSGCTAFMSCTSLLWCQMEALISVLLFSWFTGGIPKSWMDASKGISISHFNKCWQTVAVLTIIYGMFSLYPCQDYATLIYLKKIYTHSNQKKFLALRKRSRHKVIPLTETL